MYSFNIYATFFVKLFPHGMPPIFYLDYSEAEIQLETTVLPGITRVNVVDIRKTGDITRAQLGFSEIELSAEHDGSLALFKGIFFILYEVLRLVNEVPVLSACQDRKFRDGVEGNQYRKGYIGQRCRLGTDALVDLVELLRRSFSLGAINEELGLNAPLFI